MKKKARLAIGLLLVALTLGAFVYYLSGHQELLRQLRNTSPAVIAWLLLLYCAWFWAIMLTMQAALRICRMTLPMAENLLLNAYSTLVNFFVPGQGGLALRGVYLKKRHNLRIRNYVLSVMVYYACYALVSAFLLLVTSRPWWQTVFGVVVVGFISLVGLRWYAHRSPDQKDKLDFGAPVIAYMMIATVIQAVVQVTIYMVELHTVNPHIRLSQAITYTGAANFSLFVALTPGAIGIRESFLLFSERLHHVSTANVVAASLIDRAVFLVFLGLIFLFTLSIHAKNRLQIGQGGRESTPTTADR